MLLFLQFREASLNKDDAELRKVMANYGMWYIALVTGCMLVIFLVWKPTHCWYRWGCSGCPGIWSGSAGVRDTEDCAWNQTCWHWGAQPRRAFCLDQQILYIMEILHWVDWSHSPINANLIFSTSWYFLSLSTSATCSHVRTRCVVCLTEGQWAPYPSARACSQVLYVVWHFRIAI